MSRNGRPNVKALTADSTKRQVIEGKRARSYFAKAFARKAFPAVVALRSSKILSQWMNVPWMKRRIFFSAKALALPGGKFFQPVFVQRQS